MEMIQLVLGPVSTNVWILRKEGRNDCVIVDPADNGPRIIDRIKKEGVIPAGILLTHGHFDHIMAVPALKKAYPGLKVYASEAERGLLKDPEQNLSGSWMGRPLMLEPEKSLRDGEEFEAAGFCFQMMLTPGHTAGSCCYYLKEEEILLSGDTLFANSYGRVDLPTGSGMDMYHSLKNKVLMLPAETKVYPGHGDTTTIEWEQGIV